MGGLFFADALGALVEAVGGDFFLFDELSDGAASFSPEQDKGEVFLGLARFLLF